MLSQILELCGLTRAGHTPEITNGFHLSTPWSRIGIPIGTDYLRPVDYAVLQRSFATLPAGQFLTLHSGYTQAPLDLIRQQGMTAFLLLRDPRAVVTSFVHYVTKTRNHPMHQHINTLAPDARYQFAIDGGWTGQAYCEPIWGQVNALRHWAEAPDVISLRFEDLVGPAGGGDEDAQRNSFAKIGKALDLNRPALRHARQAFFGASETFRSGKIDAWRTEMPTDAQDRMAEIIAHHLAWTGYCAGQSAGAPLHNTTSAR